MTDFELNIPEEIESTAWIEADPFNNERICRIILHVDWETEEAEIRTEYNTSGMDYRTFMHLASEWSLPDDVDASTFKEYYNYKIKPIVVEMSKKFEVYWNGSNYKGRFTSGDVDEDGYDLYNPLDDEMEIANLLLDVWRHDKYIYFDVAESFQSYVDIIDDLKYDNIDFMNADLENDDVIKQIREALDGGDVVYIMSDEQFANDLKSMRETIIEDMEEQEDKE